VYNERKGGNNPLYLSITTTVRTIIIIMTTTTILHKGRRTLMSWRRGTVHPDHHFYRLSAVTDMLSDYSNEEGLEWNYDETQKTLHTTLPDTILILRIDWNHTMEQTNGWEDEWMDGWMEHNSCVTNLNEETKVLKVDGSITYST
jgi:hypothetical protein